MGTVAISRPSTVLLRLLQAVADGQQESPGKQWQLPEARAMEVWATKAAAATTESFIFASVTSEGAD
jgi:hypothetical protein